MKKIHNYRGFTFEYFKTSKQKGGGGYYHGNICLGGSIDTTKQYIDWCFENPLHENCFLNLTIQTRLS